MPHLPPVPEPASATASASASAAAEGVAFFNKASVDGPHKDRRHARMPASFSLALRFRALDMPAEWAAVLASPEPLPALSPSSALPDAQRDALQFYRSGDVRD